MCAALGERLEHEALTRIPVRLECLKNAIDTARRGVQQGLATRNPPASRASTEGETVSYVSVAALLPAGRAALAALREKAEIGFRVFKWKVGVGDLQDELVWLDELCGELPAGAKLRLDANGAWERRQAERWLERCADRPIDFLEQPVARDRKGADDLLMGLAEDYPTPIALDESIVGMNDLDKWLGAGWRGVFVVKPALLGDAETSLTKLSAAKASVVFSSALETAVGARAALEHAFAWTGERRAVGFGVWPLFADARFDGPAAAPFIRREDLDRVNPETIWNALS